MNCGSDTNVDLEEYRTFVGDENSNTSFSVGKSKSIHNENPLPGTSPLYHTARIYTKISSYMLDITQTGSYLVRLHFFPFSFKGTHLADALFNVSASNFSLLTDFRVPNSTTEFPVIKEFFLTIAAGNFEIYFQPAEETTFAFVNAIEAFLLPPNFFMDNSTIPPLQTKDGALRTLYRINVGGPEVNDTLWRNWVPDDDYLAFGGSGASRSFGGELHEASQGLIVQEIAPDSVYKTCKEARVDNKGASNFPNITWRFNVSKKARHLVRLHFCDFISESPGTVKFDLNISTNFSHVIDPNSGGFSEMASPFFYDFVVPSDDSGYMSFSIAPGNNSTAKVAFLNGLEIMEFVGNTIVVVPVDEHETKKHLALIIGSAGGVALVLVLILLFSLCLRLKRPKPVKAEFLYGKGRSSSWITERTENASSKVTNLNLKLKISLAEILAATHNFNPKLLIGEGGFGKVYKGTLESGMKVAVKRSDSSHGQGLPEFQTEIMVLSKIQHRHLVSLVGYCDEGSEMILVFEFMEKGTLREHLYGKESLRNPSAKIELTWKQRLEICIGSAKGIHYLHTGPDGGIFHRDVKSTNILLDEHYVAKVADFGLSQLGMPDPDHISVGLKGSFGYLDPEYFRTFQLTNKSDVYSFGVVLLEVLCARPPIVDSQQREEINLAEWGMFWQKEGQLEKIMDPLLAGHINPNSLRKFGEIVEMCLKPQGTDRPNMIDVCWDLEYAMQLQQTAVHREAHEDNTATGVSSDSALPLMQNMSSNTFPMDDYSDTTDTVMYPN
ncbi:hypothetical protein NC653_013861 [Populus alba x Populus x berolinensis]|uniref:Protein kinase domain-containing protein n=2 Tax=Populus TaxID=3689 RepID=A0A8X7ZVL0_POPTO|nr:hypothetical protein POTOM_019404 [Populus tomentosa]KAJ6997418.1 hypothetical protein NC653_013861 [Populus alba x Populus x berolinensis]